MKKINPMCLKKIFNRDISIAKSNNFCAILLPYDLEYEAYFIDCDVDLDEIYNIGSDLGWDRFYYIDFVQNTEEEINFYTLEDVA